jgi:hypothetical protein
VDVAKEGWTLHLLYTDEVNVDPENSEFFVYAGVAVPGENAAALSTDIENLRRSNGYVPGDLLKFNTRERPRHISPEQHLEAKREVMDAAAEHGVKLIAPVREPLGVPVRCCFTSPLRQSLLKGQTSTFPVPVGDLHLCKQPCGLGSRQIPVVMHPNLHF